MDKIKSFRNQVKLNRKLLINYGFIEATVNSWAYTDRIPSYENAIKLAGVLNMRVSDIPYYLKERVI